MYSRRKVRRRAERLAFRAALGVESRHINLLNFIEVLDTLEESRLPFHDTGCLQQRLFAVPINLETESLST